MPCPNNDNHKVVLVEYSIGSPEQYDGVSEVQCLDENKRFGRWCEEELAADELEPRFCEGGPHPKINR